MPICKLAKFLLQLFLASLTENECTVTNSFHFAEEICKQGLNSYMASLDVDPLFTNIPQDKTINICIDSLYNDNENSLKILKDISRNVLNIGKKESFFMFNNKFYKPINGVATGSPLSPALANTFMSSLENKWLKDGPRGLKHVFFRRHIDDIFVLFPSINHAKEFKKYLSPKHPNRNFSLKKENDRCLSFLDINNFLEKGKYFAQVSFADVQ